MNIKKLIQTTKKPDIYSPGTAEMWTDKHISQQLLAIHLNQDIELASRKKSTISSTIEWISNKVPDERLNILDLGCGPGLYCEKLAEKGHQVTGMDFSANSIFYARDSAARKNMDITYLQQNYLEMKEEKRFDLILMIFTDFGVLLPDQRDVLLANIYRALKPGGKFFFDVLNKKYPVRQAGTKEWEVSEKGFWRENPYLALTESFYYENQQVLLSQHTVIEETGETDIYRFWIHTFSDADLKEILQSQGFSSIECYDHVIPDCDQYQSESVTFCITTR